MSVLNTFTLCYMIFFLISQCYFASAAPTNTAAIETSEPKTKASSFHHNIINTLMQHDGVKFIENIVKGRYKRQSGTGGNDDGLSSETIMRLFIKLLRKLYSRNPNHSDHPMNKENAKPVFDHIKKKYFSIFFDEI